MNMVSVPSQLAALAHYALKLSMMLFAYFIPAFSSVKAVVRKDSEEYHQWSMYWLILNLYVTVLSPFLHLTLHPIFQLIAVLWLSLPQYQGASVVYDRIVVPWVDRYEERVDDAVEEVHRSVMSWVWSRLGRFTYVLMGEGGSLAGELLNVVTGLVAGDDVQFFGKPVDPTIQPSNSTNSLLNPRHSLREGLSQSSFEEVGEAVPSDEFVRDFMAMLQQGLYVFANVVADEATESLFERGHKLGIFSYDGGVFSITPVAVTAGAETGTKESTPVRLPLDNLRPPRATGAQGLILECQETGNVANNISVEMVLSDESDRNILLSGLEFCLPNQSIMQVE